MSNEVNIRVTYKTPKSLADFQHRLKQVIVEYNIPSDATMFFRNGFDGAYIDISWDVKRRYVASTEYVNAEYVKDKHNLHGSKAKYSKSL